jgi:hypothetical protein
MKKDGGSFSRSESNSSPRLSQNILQSQSAAMNQEYQNKNQESQDKTKNVSFSNFLYDINFIFRVQCCLEKFRRISFSVKN